MDLLSCKVAARANLTANLDIYFAVSLYRQSPADRHQVRGPAVRGIATLKYD